MIQAVTIVMQKDNKFLLGKRSDWKSKAPGYWCPVSGKIEAGESEEAAVVREAMEEVGLEVVPVRKITTIDSYDKTVRLHWWLVEIRSGEAHLKNNEHSEIRWVTLSEMTKLNPFFAEDLAIYQNL